MSNKLRIAISGKSGCGNTTVSNLVKEELQKDWPGIELINYTFHSMADEMEIDFSELCALAEHDDRYDRMVDTRQVEMARGGSCVLASRLAVWLLEEANLKVFLTAPVEVRARRIANREGKSFDTALRETLERDKRDRKRYMRLYNIDNNDFSFVDLVIDTENYNQKEVADIILKRTKDLG